jgi:hypothetical protein
MATTLNPNTVRNLLPGGGADVSERRPIPLSLPLPGAPMAPPPGMGIPAPVAPPMIYQPPSEVPGKPTQAKPAAERPMTKTVPSPPPSWRPNLDVAKPAPDGPPSPVRPEPRPRAPGADEAAADEAGKAGGEGTLVNGVRLRPGVTWEQYQAARPPQRSALRVGGQGAGFGAARSRAAGDAPTAETLDSAGGIYYNRPGAGYQPPRPDQVAQGLGYGPPPGSAASVAMGRPPFDPSGFADILRGQRGGLGGSVQLPTQGPQAMTGGGVTGGDVRSPPRGGDSPYVLPLAPSGIQGLPPAGAPPNGGGPPSSMNGGGLRVDPAMLAEIQRLWAMGRQP